MVREKKKCKVTQSCWTGWQQMWDYALRLLLDWWPQDEAMLPCPSALSVWPPSLCGLPASIKQQQRVLFYICMYGQCCC